MFVLCGLVFIWRVNILKERWRAPGHILKTSFIAIVLGLLFVEYQQWVAIEPMLALLLSAITLKLLEIRSRKDLVLILFLSYFVIACSFLFSQTVMQTIFGLLSVVMVTMVLLQVYSAQYTLKVPLSLAITMLLQSVILTLVMTLILPRFGPLWTVPLQSNQAEVGMSDSMSPGDFNNLIQSDRLALRVTFEDQVLSREAMYWRGLVFDKFDGRRWERSSSISNSIAFRSTPQNEHAAKPSAGVRYDVLMEATSNRWLYGIPKVVITHHNAPLFYTNQNEILQKKDVNQRIKYSAVSYSEPFLADTRLSKTEYRQYTALPKGSNPQTQKQALAWYSEARGAQQYVSRVLQYYKDNFTYTLSPPKLGKHTADEFLFSTLEGFCEHFSSSFVVLMRSAGIPARVVVGYQGGEWDEGKSYVSVYQRDAHAWAEVWLEGKGWVRVDPTAAVAAIRLEQGVAAALPQSERSLVGGSGLSFVWLNDLQEKWRQMDYKWQRWVLDFDTQSQQNILKKYLGYVTPAKIALLVVGTFLIVAVFIGFVFFKNDFVFPKKESRLYRKLKKRLAAHGVSAKSGETIANYCHRSSESLPLLKETLLSLKTEFECVFYSKTSNNEKGMKASFLKIERLLKKI